MEKVFELLDIKLNSYKDFAKIAVAFIIIGFIFNLVKDLLG